MRTSTLLFVNAGALAIAFSGLVFAALTRSIFFLIWNGSLATFVLYRLSGIAKEIDNYEKLHRQD